MSMRPIRSLTAVGLLCLFEVVAAAGVSEARGPSLIGIDHVPTVVADLEQAIAAYERLGFSLKPGRFHENGLRNSHIKFRDGSGVELISPPEQPTDALTRKYSEMLQDAEGPAYLSFHARDMRALISALREAGISFEDRGGLITLGEANLDFIFFIEDNRSPTDKPEHFAHPNTAVAMEEVRLALDRPSRESLRRLLLALGAAASSGRALLPAEAHAEVFTVQNGRVLVVDDDHQLHKGRPIVGATFRVLNARTGAAAEWADPDAAHGFWLRFEQQPSSPRDDARL